MPLRNRTKIVPDYWDEALECISPEELLEIRTLKMQKHLRYAHQNSLFYKRSFDKAGLRPEEIKDLEDYRQRVPFLTHEQLIENQLANPPFGDFLAVGLKDIRRIYCSPGPLMVPFSRSDMDNYINTTANGLYICGARRGDIVDITYAYQWDLAGTMLDDGFRRLGCAVVPGGTGTTRTHVGIMKYLGVTVVFAFPPFAMKLAKTCREMGIDPKKDLKVRLIIVRSEEVCNEDEKRVLSEIFGAEVRAMYGGAEAGFVAAECGEGGGMHCFSDSILEVIDPVSCRPVAPGQRGEIVTTDMSRSAMPFIRYRTGDITEGLNMAPCPCGRTSPRLGRIIGRRGNIVRVRGVYLVPKIVKKVLDTYDLAGRFQIIIERKCDEESLCVKVELSDMDRGSRLREELIEELRTNTRLRFEIVFVPLGTIASNEALVLDKRWAIIGYK